MKTALFLTVLFVILSGLTDYFMGSNILSSAWMYITGGGFVLAVVLQGKAS